ncbi:hypothetical protein BLNAU_7538 [Blattamonas nauphoetae]|uniref:Transposase n=1 Tax=Blattamonas nauphoetae TaxID=2049346 RepID=A0ABQ9Y0W9_9EUKA|nr:hypothetical protein BLNAU_7538 [Blattamonas nauphoetae]
MICRFFVEHEFKAKDVITALHIPKSTFYDGLMSLRKGYRPGRRGVHSKLRDEEDRLLRELVEERCNAGRNPTANDVTAQTHFHTVTPLTPTVANNTPDIDAILPLAPTIPGATIVFLVAADGEATQKNLQIYFLAHIVPAIDSKKKIPATPLSHAILLLDGAPYHNHEEVMRTAKDNLIDLIFIPPNTSRYTQPVDQSINAVFRNILSQHIQDHITIGAAANRQSFMQAFLQACDSAISHRSIQHSFVSYELRNLMRRSTKDRIRIVQDYYRFRSAFAAIRCWNRPDPPCSQTIKNIISRFEATGTVADLPRSGRNATTSTPENCRAVDRHFSNHPTRSIFSR